MDDRETRRLYRSDTDKMICGVCGGIGEYFNVDATLIRLLWAVLACSGTAYAAQPIVDHSNPDQMVMSFSELPCSGTGVVAYFIAAIIIPRR